MGVSTRKGYFTMERWTCLVACAIPCVYGVYVLDIWCFWKDTFSVFNNLHAKLVSHLYHNMP